MFKNSNFHLLRFLIVFAVLTAGFYTYVGIVSPGGRYHSSFLENYLNIPAWVTYFISTSAKAILQVLGYDVFQYRPDNVTIRGSHGVTILWACLGFGVLSFWVAFVTAHRAGWKFLFKWSAWGIALITGLNIIRIALIALASFHHWEAFLKMDAHRSFNIVTYIAIFGLMWWFVEVYRKYAAGNIRTPKQRASLEASNNVQ